MLTITIDGKDFYDEKTNQFITYESVIVEFEHSLVSLSKWESKFGKPFLLDNDNKSQEEIKGYIEAMATSDNFTPDMFDRMTQENFDAINNYIKSSQSATTFADVGAKRGYREIITSEVIYYWMVACNIPLECESWHLNRLFALIRIYNIKNSKDKRMPRRDAAAQQRALNETRRREMGSKG